MHKRGFIVKEFLRVLARPPVDPNDFVYGEIRNRIIAMGRDDNGTVRYAAEEAIIERESFTKEQKHFLINYGLIILNTIHTLVENTKMKID